VWLKGLLGGAGEFGKQGVAGGVSNHTVTIGATRLPQNVPTSVEHLEIQERAAEAHSRREVVTGKILDRTSARSCPALLVTESSVTCAVAVCARKTAPSTAFFWPL